MISERHGTRESSHSGLEKQQGLKCKKPTEIHDGTAECFLFRGQTSDGQKRPLVVSSGIYLHGP